MTALRLKTVFDATRPDPTGLLTAQLRLHVASWRTHVRSAAGLTVTSVGEPPAPLRAWLTEREVEVDVVPGPHHLAERSVIYNKHLAAAHPAGERVFLTDNDTVYLGDVTPLLEVPDAAVAAALADRRRVAPELWERLRSGPGIGVIELDWVPWKERALAEVEGRDAEHERYAYFNGGAVLFPPGADFWDRWEAETVRLSAWFESRGMDDRKDAGSDQLSLTSAAAGYGEWRFLPSGYNVRPFHFWLREPVLERVDHLHLVATGGAHRSLPPRRQVSMTALLEQYWKRMILPHLSPAMRPHADVALEQTLAIVADHDLERIAPLD